MSLIGNDLVPNAYIDRINVYDGKLEITAYCVDQAGTPVWSDHALSMKYLKFMIVSTSNTSLMNSFEFGTIKMDKKAILKEDPDATITLIPVRSSERVLSGDFDNFKIKVKHDYENANSLNVYVAIIADPVQIAGTKFINEGFISGPVVSERVFMGGQINTLSSVWVLPDGTQWNGPIHRHPTMGYMQFSSHTDEEHQRVTPVEIRNLKIKDLRQKLSYASSLRSIKNDITEISSLYNSFDSMGQNNSIFFLNMKQIISKNTKFGNIFLSLEPRYYKKMINKVSFRLVRIERRMVRTNYTNNSLRINKILETKKIISAYQSGETFITTFGEGTIRKTIFPIDDTIFSFEFRDPEANVNLSGQFQYNVTFYFADPTVEEVNSILKELNDANKNLNKYLGRIARNLKTAEAKNNPPSAWIESEVNLFSDDTNLSPWIHVPTVYAKYKKMFFDISDDFEAIRFESYSKLDPRSFTTTSINKFKSQFDSLVSHINKTFNVRTHPISNFSDISMPKNSYISNLIEKKFHFRKIIEPSLNRKFYNVMEDAGEHPFTKRLSLPAFKYRVAQEQAKFFNQDITQAQDVKTDLKTSMASYFSPISLGDSEGNKIPLDNLSNVDKEQFNTFFDNVPEPRFRKFRESPRARLRNLRSRFAVTSRMVPIEVEKYIDASDYLGDESVFVTPDEEERKKLYQKALQRKVQNSVVNSVVSQRSTGRQRNLTSTNNTNNIFTDRVSARAPRTPSGRTLIPNQFRSLNSELVPISENSLSEEEIQEAENDLIVSVNYFNLTQIEALVDFSTNPDGVRNMHNPTWELVTMEALDSLSDGFLCRIEQIMSPISNFESDSRTQLPISDKYFILSDVSLPSVIPDVEDEIDSSLVDSFNSSVSFKLAGANSEIISQNLTTESEIFKVKIEDFSVTPQTATSIERTVPRTPRINPARPIGGNRSGGGEY